MTRASTNERDQLRVLLVAPVFPLVHGGIANWTRILLKRIAETPDVEVTYVDTAVRWRPATNHSPFLRATGGSIQMLRDSLRVWVKTRREQPSVIHICSSAGPALVKDFVMLQLARRLRVPAIIHFRVGDLPDIIQAGGWLWKLLSGVLRSATQVVVLDATTCAAIRARLPECNVCILPNMVELDVIDLARGTADSVPARQATDEMRVVYCGHLVPAKGVEELVRACLALDVPWVLDFVGDAAPALQAKLEALAATAGKSAQVRFHGNLDHQVALQFISSADLFVLPSYTEGAPNVVLEAMACARSILGTTVGAMPEMLDIGGSDECGVCVAPRDVEQLKIAMHRLLKSSALRRSYGEKARSRVERLYSATAVSNRVIELWRSLAHGPTRS